jgi:hypothetical protein
LSTPSRAHRAEHAEPAEYARLAAYATFVAHGELAGTVRRTGSNLTAGQISHLGANVRRAKINIDEVDSREYHFDAAAWNETMRRHDRMTAAGLRVLHFSPARIRSEPDWVIETIRKTLASGLPIPGLRTVPASAKR